MARRRLQMTLADYVVIAISPALIMLMVGSLVFFLLEVAYRGQFEARLHWIMFWFVMATVLIARISIEEGAEKASLYGLALALAVAVSMLRFLDSPIVAWLSMALVWWCAHKLTWDCTLIDDTQDASGRGLLQIAGLDNDAPAESVAESNKLKARGRRTQTVADALADANGPDDQQPSEPPRPTIKGWWRSRFADPQSNRRRPHAPGLWVVYFSLAALPLFGLGQAAIPADDTARRSYAFWLLFWYVAAALGLLLTTSFLGLRRYLRQRNLKMPASMTRAWLGVGAALIVVLLFAATLLPRPSPEYSLADSVQGMLTSPVRSASKFALLRDSGVEQGTGPQSTDPPPQDQPAGQQNPGQNPAQQNPAGQDAPGEQDKNAEQQGDSPAQGNPAQDGSPPAGQASQQDSEQSSSGSDQQADKGGQSAGQGNQGQGDPKSPPKSSDQQASQPGDSDSPDQERSQPDEPDDSGRPEQQSNRQDSNQSQPNQSQPNQSQPNQSQPNQSQPNQPSDAQQPTPGQSRQSSQQQPPDQHSADQKPSDRQPPDQQPSDRQPSDQQPSDQQPSDQQPSDQKPSDQKPSDQKPSDQKPSDQKPSDQKPSDQKPSDQKPSDQQPSDQQPSDQQPSDQQQPPNQQPPEQQPSDEPPSEQSSSSSGPPPSPDTQPQSKPSRFKLPSFSLPTNWLRWLVYLALAVAGVYFFIRYRDQVLPFLRRLWQELMDLLAGLSGRNKPAAAPTAAAAVPAAPKPFADFVNPFASGAADRASVDQVVRYTFEAVEAWSFERGLGRRADETPLEFARALAVNQPHMKTDVRELAELYVQITYARARLQRDSLVIPRRIWTSLQHATELAT